MKISAVVIAKNEENNITDCVKSLLWCDEIVIVDDLSTDGTKAKINSQFTKEAATPEIRIISRESRGDFAGQRNFGLEKAKGDWILFVDADEKVSEGLRREIMSLTGDTTRNGYFLRRKDYFLGKWLNHGETGSVKLMRLGRKSSGKWQGAVHEIWQITGETACLQNPLEHFPHPTVAEFIRDINIYSDTLVSQWEKEERTVNSWEIAVYPLGKFIQNYFLRLGFMDGTPGLIVAVLMSFHSFLVRSKYWLLRYKKQNHHVR